jgi:hypothetical protein
MQVLKIFSRKQVQIKFFYLFNSLIIMENNVDEAESNQVLGLITEFG